MMESPDFIVIDLFCGAGGTTIGIEQAEYNGRKVGVVIAAVNHDAKAIKSHWSNHRHVVHFEEDIRSLPLEGLRLLLQAYRRMWPTAKVVLWASLECTHFSKAKGGQAREADSRTLGKSLYMRFNETTRRYSKGDSYIQILQPDYIHIENVEEFLSWGPLDRIGKPVQEKKGMHFRAWCKAIRDLGYRDDWRMINAADHGAYTKRKRLFGCFAKGDLPIIWPQQSHSRTGDMFTRRWKPVKDVLDFTDEGISIFPAHGGRSDYLSPKTYARILAGCRRYITGDSTKAAFLLKYNSTNQATGLHIPPSIDEPAPVVATQSRLGLVQPTGFLAKYHGNGENVTSLDEPSSTLTTKDRLAKVQTVFIDRQYTSGGRHSSVDEPIGALPTVPKANMVKVDRWIESFYRGDYHQHSIEGPCPTVTVRPHEALVKCDRFIVPQNYDNGPVSLEEPMQTITANRKHHYLVNPQWALDAGASVSDPCFTLIARMDKAPPYLVTLEGGQIAIEVYDQDPDIVRDLKAFMAAHGIIDIKMRMLRIKELKRIQGFPEDYHLAGSQADQKKFIGNSVHPVVPKRWYEAKAAVLRAS